MSGAGPAQPWHWVSEHDPGEGMLDRGFPSQGEAESWLGESYPDIVEAGLGSVSLYEADRRVYGPMNLEVD